jgi:uncharacterized protein YbbK (DUF523 family)
MNNPPQATQLITVGISTCLLGEKVRFDAGHKHDKYITDILGAHFQFIPVCPELEVGMGVPREPVRLVGTVKNPHMIGIKSATDWTERMNAYSKERVKQLEFYNLSGYIFKADSPSCGMERVRVYSDKGMPTRTGQGLYTRVFVKHFPLIPLEEKKEIIQIIADYHHQIIPLIVPITVISHYIRKHKIPYIKDQVYLNPHPKELMLRNHV